MNDNQVILKRAETMGTIRILALTLLALSVFGVCGILILKHVDQSLLTQQNLEDIRYVSQALWFASFMTVVVINVRIRRNPQLKGLIDDERAKAIRSKSFVIGFWTFLIAAVAGVFAALFSDIDAKSLLLLILCIGGTAPAFARTLLSLQS